MIVGIIDQSVVGKNNTLCAAGFFAECVNIAFGVFSGGFLGKLSLIVSEIGAADAATGGIGFERTALPAELLCFLL